jgi:opacity protein-like surface antigen
MRGRKKLLISIAYLSVVLVCPVSVQAENLKLRGTVGRAEVHLMPYAGSTVIGVIRLGEVLKSDKQVGEWFRVILPPNEKGFILTGFVHSREVEVISGKPEEKPGEEIPMKKEKPFEKKPVEVLPIEKKPVEEKPILPPPEPIESPISPQPPKPPPVQPSPAPRPTRPGPKFSLKFYGGMNNMLFGDLNDALQGTTDYYQDLPNVDIGEELQPVHWGFDFGGEFIINLTPRIGIGLGGGYIQVSKKTTIDVTWEGSPYKDTVHPKATVIPLTFSIHVGLPLGNIMNFTLNAGAGYYLGTIQWHYSWDSEFHDYEENWKAKSNTVGFQGSLGLELNISRNLALVVEGFGRYAKLKSLKGDYTWKRDFFGHEEGIIEEATLWYYDWRSSDTGNEYPRIKFDDDVPTETSFQRNIREGEVDLTGFSFRLGIKIRF